ncbi:MAG: hypothetical protein K8F62_20320, partial [Pseudorhodoplanes sp.]|nr:hypothetical protein [Pseudorhodoplanes sp.]
MSLSVIPGSQATLAPRNDGGDVQKNPQKKKKPGPKARLKFSPAREAGIPSRGEHLRAAGRDLG